MEDKVFTDITEREKERIKSEDDLLEELKIYDLTVITDYIKKMGKKMLMLLINKAPNIYGKSSIDEFDGRLIEDTIPS